MEKVTIYMQVSVHKIKADIMKAIYSEKIDLRKDSLRTIAEKIGLKSNSAQVIKHHLEALVNMGTLDKKEGQYWYIPKGSTPFTPFKPA